MVIKLKMLKRMNGKIHAQKNTFSKNKWYM